MFAAVGLSLAVLLGASAASAASPFTLTPKAESDKIGHLPGFDGKTPFEQYGGYLDVDQSHGRNLFYWFVESQKDPANDPIVLWLQGGPGCSSLLGLLSENGPFHADPSGTQVSLNPYSWNKLANVLYLEAPAGVGFSYSNDKADYTTGDQKTADDNYKALLEFFARHPQMNSTGRPFYLTGESYAGHYLPDLAARILLGNRMGNPHINLKGFADGNPLTDLKSNFYDGSWPTYWSHALISPATHSGFVNDCKTFPDASKECLHWMDVAQKDMQFINPYDIYVPVCVSPSSRAIARALAPHNPMLRAHADSNLGTPGIAPGEYDPCIDKHLTNFLNRKEVKEAIHADPKITWTDVQRD
jgi:serine carboxypeptidase-like clade II